MAPWEKMQAMMKDTTPEAQAEQNKAWMTWMEGKKSMIEPGAPLGKTMRATAAGVESARNNIGGYSIVQASSHEEAAKLFMDNPMLMGMPEASVEVMEIMPMPM